MYNQSFDRFRYNRIESTLIQKEKGKHALYHNHSMTRHLESFSFCVHSRVEVLKNTLLKS